MSHANVTVTRTVTTSHPNAIFLNVGYLKSPAGLLKIGQLILGGAVIALILNNGEYFRSRYDQIYYAYGCHYFSYSCKAMLFMLLMATTFFICTFILLLSCIFSFSTGGLISKTLYELIYHMFAAILLLVASILNYLSISDNQYDWYWIATFICFVNFILYLISTVLAFREYRY